MFQKIKCQTDWSLQHFFFPTDTSDWAAHQLHSRLHGAVGAVPRLNPRYSGFVWRKPANYITLISQAVFIHVITMRRTVVKRSICHLNTNDFSIFAFGGINLSNTRLILKQTDVAAHGFSEDIPRVNTVYDISWCWFWAEIKESCLELQFTYLSLSTFLFFVILISQLIV